METIWFECYNTVLLADVMGFARWLILHKVPFSVEYDGCKVGFSGLGMEEKQLEYDRI